MKHYVSAEAVFTSLWIGEMDIPDDVVSMGRAATRAWIKERVIDSLHDDLEIDELSISFDKDEEEENL